MGDTPPVPWWNLLALWRGLAGAGLLASLVLTSLLLTRPAAINPTAYVVVLTAPQSQAPGWVIQASNDQQIQLIPPGRHADTGGQGTGVLDQG